MYHLGFKDEEGNIIKAEPGFKKLRELSVASLPNVLEGPVIKLIQTSNSIEEIDLNNFKSLSEYGLSLLAKIPTVKKILMNLSENISDQALSDARAHRPDIQFVRSITKASEEKDTGLVIQWPAKMKEKKSTKKGGKKKKK